MYNPSLQEESRYEPASVIPLKGDASLLEWLRLQGRLIPREVPESQVAAEQDDDGISELILEEDQVYDSFDSDNAGSDDFED